MSLKIKNTNKVADCFLCGNPIEHGSNFTSYLRRGYNNSKIKRIEVYQHDECEIYDLTQLQVLIE